MSGPAPDLRPLELELPPQTGTAELLREIADEDIYRLRRFRGARTILDCGAHAGVFSCYAARLHPAARVVAVEAHPDNFRFLTANLARNGLDGRVEPLWAAVAAAAGTRPLYQAALSECHTTFLPGPRFYRERLTCRGEVPALSLADCLARLGSGPVDLVKIDCEGAEDEILRAASAATLGRIRRLALELHTDLAGMELPELLELLGRRGFRTDAAPSSLYRERWMVHAWRGEGW